jgi:hypothetical protein
MTTTYGCSQLTDKRPDKQKARLVEKLFGDEQFEVPSSTPGKSYTVLVTNSDGRISCPCRGWTTKKPGRFRICKHIEELIYKHGWKTHTDLDYVYRITTEA